MIEFSCDKCGKKYRVNEKFAGSSVNCTDCGEHLRVPGTRIQEQSSPKENLAERSPVLRVAKGIARAASATSADKYPWLRGYIGWLRFWGYVGNVIGALGIVFGSLMLLGDELVKIEGWGLIFGSLWTIFSFNFLFVIAELIRLLLDAKSELTELVESLRSKL